MSLFSWRSLNLQIAEDTLFDSALNVVPTNIAINVSTSSSNAVSDVDGESFFTASTQTSVLAGVSLSYGGEVFATITVQPNFGSSSLIEIAPSLGDLTVLVTLNGKPYANATVSLRNDASNGSLSQITHLQGNATFYGPAGNYTLTVSANGTSIRRSVSLVEGGSGVQLVTLGPNPGGGGGPIGAGDLEILIAASIMAAIGIAANVWVWVLRPRR